MKNSINKLMEATPDWARDIIDVIIIIIVVLLGFSVLTIIALSFLEYVLKPVLIYLGLI